MYGTAVRLAFVLSAIAAVVALGLDAAGDVSAVRLVIAVAAIGFVTSWVQTGRVSRSAPLGGQHRIAVIPLRHSIH